MNNEEIRKKLLSMGAPEKDLNTLIKNVSEVALTNFLVAYSAKLDNAQKETLSSIDETLILEYLNTHKHELPAVSSEEFIKIWDETWNNYFQSVSSK